MQALSAPELLRVWEVGSNQSPEQRALALLGAANIASEKLEEMQLGQRDAHLLVLRERMFGSQIAAVATCPFCGERLELAFEVADILVHDSDTHSAGCDTALTLESQEYTVEFRVPNSRDMIEVMAESQAVGVTALGHSEAGLNSLQLALLKRCILSVKHSGICESVDDLPDVVVKAVIDKIAAADPQANIDLDMGCPSCEHHWLAAFDIVSFLWSEIETWSRRLLTDVHHLALVYGWSESDILTMSPLRRRIYLEMINDGR